MYPLNNNKKACGFRDNGSGDTIYATPMVISSDYAMPIWIWTNDSLLLAIYV